jgi:hypothetical protein
MKNLFKPLGIIVLVAVIGLSMASCAMLTSISGTTDAHGIFTGNGAAGSLTEGATEIASYSVILGIVDSGYAEYAAAVKAAEAEGKKITSVTKWLVFIVKTTAYAQ